MTTRSFSIASVLALLVANVAVASNSCFSLLAPPTAAELAMSSEERVALLYSRLLEQYRGTLSEDEYVKFLVSALKSKSYYAISPTSASQFEMKTVFERIREMRSSEVLPNGVKLNGAEIDAQIQKRLDAELISLRKVSEVIKEAVEASVPTHGPGRELIGTPSQVLHGHENSVCSVQVSPDFKQAISGANDYTLKHWNLLKGTSIRTLTGHEGAILAVEVSSDFKRVISGSLDESLIVWDLESGRSLKQLKGHTGAVNSVAVSPDFKRAISASSDGTLIVWDLEKGKKIRQLTGHVGRVGSVRVSPDFKRAISGSSNGGLFVWDLETGKIISKLEGHSNGVTSVQVNADFTRAISVSIDGLWIWDLRLGLGRLVIQDTHTTAWSGSIAVNPNFTVAITSTEGNDLIAWDLDRGTELTRLKGHANMVNALQVGADFKPSSSPADDRTVIIRAHKQTESL